MKNIIVIAKNTFREAIRDKVLYAILGFAALFILSDLFISEIATGDIVPVKSFGLGGIYIFGIITTIFLGSSIVYKEIELRTLYFVLSKPVSRASVLLGKYIGLLAAITAITLLMTAVYLAVVFYESGQVDYRGLVAVLLQIMEQGLFVALLIFLSSALAPLTSTICSIMLLFVGHLIGPAAHESKTIGGAAAKLVSFIYYVFPNLEKFNVRNLVAHDAAIPASLIMLSLLYAVIYSAVLLYLANLLFKRREL